MTFRTLEDADNYLAFWLGDGGAVSRLRHALRALGQEDAVSRRSDRQVIRALAASVVAGSLNVREQGAPRRYMDVPSAFERAAARKAAAAAVASGGVAVRPPAPTVATPPLAPPRLLPALEEVQIEGAQVMPEILQTLEQIDLGLDGLHMASVSLEPTPSAVPRISDAMTTASASVTASIDEM